MDFRQLRDDSHKLTREHWKEFALYIIVIYIASIVRGYFYDNSLIAALMGIVSIVLSYQIVQKALEVTGYTELHEKKFHFLPYICVILFNMLIVFAITFLAMFLIGLTITGGLLHGSFFIADIILLLAFFAILVGSVLFSWSIWYVAKDCSKVGDAFRTYFKVTFNWETVKRILSVILWNLVPFYGIIYCNIVYANCYRESKKAL